MTDASSADPTSPLSTADALAETGDWPAAIDAWHRVARDQPSLRPAVERRLNWFLSEMGQASIARPRIQPLVLAFVTSSVLAMAFIMFADQPGSRSANLWAGAAWIMIAGAIITALLAAHRLGDTPLGHLAANAQRAAERLEDEHPTGESP